MRLDFSLAQAAYDRAEPDYSDWDEVETANEEEGEDPEEVDTTFPQEC